MTERITQNPELTAQEKALAHRLADIGVFQFGKFVLTSGKIVPYYLKCNLLQSDPQGALRQAAILMRDRIRTIGLPDRIAPVPFTADPVVTAIALLTGIPRITPRPEAKEHGTREQITGTWNPGETVLLIDDVVTTGGSIKRALATLRRAGLSVTDTLVLIDREEGGAEALASVDCRLGRVLTISGLLDHFDRHPHDNIPADEIVRIRRYTKSIDQRCATEIKP